MASNRQSHTGKVYFDNLDGLRFFCFLAVFLFHSFHTDLPTVKQHWLYSFFKFELFGNGFLGVNFFFVLSGFLITYLLIKEKTRNRFIHIGNFWVRRILRIWPLYFACVIYGFLFCLCYLWLLYFSIYKNFSRRHTCRNCQSLVLCWLY